MSLEISHVMRESQLWPGKALKLMWGKQFSGEPHSDVGDLALPWEPPSLMETHTLPWGIEALKKQNMCGQKSYSKLDSTGFRSCFLVWRQTLPGRVVPCPHVRSLSSKRFHQQLS